MTQQRRHGQTIVLYRSKMITDDRGNHIQIVDMDNSYTTRGWVIPQRSSRAELPGQQDLNVRRIGVPADFPGVDSWSRVLWDGATWDVVAPPARHHGERHVRHWSIDIRRRP